MPYLVVDPVDGYAARMMQFLGHRGIGAVAAFTSRQRELQWTHAWSRQLGDLVLATYQVEGADLEDLAVQIRRDWPQIAGLVTWDELHVTIASRLGELLDLGWNPYSVIERCRDKRRQKEWLRRVDGLRINASRVVTSAAEALAFQAEVDRWPIVVKPTGGAGSRNVTFPTDEGELLRRCQEVRESGDGEVLLEEYIGGEELAVNGIVDRSGDLLVTDVWHYDKRSSHGVDNLYFQSIKVGTGEPVFRAVAAYAGEVVEGLGLRRAPIHMEVKVDDRGPCLIELGARFAGGNQPYLASQLHDRSVFELAARHYLAELVASPTELDYARYDGLEARIVSGVSPVEIPRIRAVHGVEAVEQLPSFHGFGVVRPVGARLPRTVDLTSRSYEVYLIHPDGRQIARDADAVRRRLRYE